MKGILLCKLLLYNDLALKKLLTKRCKIEYVNIFFMPELISKRLKNAHFALILVFWGSKFTFLDAFYYYI